MVYYEVDIGMNTVVKKSSIQLSNFNIIKAHFLIPVDEGALIVVAEDSILHVSKTMEGTKCALPKRNDMSGDKGLFITSFGRVPSNDDLILLQNEYGDLIRVSLDQKEGSIELTCSYFDTI